MSLLGRSIELFSWFGKGKFFVILVVLTLLICGGLAFNSYNEKQLRDERFKISAPMQDYEYKRTIIETSGNKYYKLENLRPLVGPEELKEFLKAHNNDEQIYTPSQKNINEGVFKANLHMHTVFSDGEAKVNQLLDMAQEYAENNLNGADMYMAITDHNTVLGTKELIEVLQKNPNKYNKVKVVAGIEIFTAYNNSKIAPRPIEIHVLTLGLNPYDEFLNKEFFKKRHRDKWNRTCPDRDFDWVVKEMSNYGVVGVAHPARYTPFLEGDKYDYIKEMLARYRSIAGDNTIFIEGYYQVYPLLPEKAQLGSEYERYLDFINQEAKKNNIILDGSTDVHGMTIFNK